MKSVLSRLVYLALPIICLLFVVFRGHCLTKETRARPLTTADPTTQGKLNEAYGDLPLSFEINRGQADARVRFVSLSGRYSILLSSTEIAFNLNSAVLIGEERFPRLRHKGASILNDCAPQFMGVDPSARIEGAGNRPAKVIPWSTRVGLDG